MELMFGIAIVAIVVIHGGRLAFEDMAYAARGTLSPRAEMRKAAFENGLAEGKRRRYGVGGYLADLTEDAFAHAARRHDRKMAKHHRKMTRYSRPSGPLRSYAGQVWAAGWHTAGLKHQRRVAARRARRGLGGDSTVPTVDDTFSTAIRDTYTGGVAGRWGDGDPRASASDDFAPDDLKRWLSGELYVEVRRPAAGPTPTPTGPDRGDAHSTITETVPDKASAESETQADDLTDAPHAAAASGRGATDSSSSAGLAEVIPITNRTNRKDILMTTRDAELTGLEAAKEWVAALTADVTGIDQEIDDAGGHLSVAEVTGRPLELLAELGEAYEAVTELLNKLGEELAKQDLVAEAYEAAPDAGNKQFVTS